MSTKSILLYRYQKCIYFIVIRVAIAHNYINIGYITYQRIPANDDGHKIKLLSRSIPSYSCPRNLTPELLKQCLYDYISFFFQPSLQKFYKIGIMISRF